MKTKTILIFSIVFWLFLANFVAISISPELEEDPLVPGWSRDVRITNASGDSLHPSIAIDSKGWIHIVWQDARTGDWKIYYARSSDGGETFEKKVIADLPWSDNTPSITIDRNDVIHVVWSASADGTTGGIEIYYKNSTDGGTTWREDVRLTYAPDRSLAPRVVANENALHVVWSDKRDGNYEIYYKRSDDEGNNWGENLRLTDDGGSSKLPSLAVDSIGGLHVAWYDKRSTSYKIYYRKSIDGGNTWNNETCLSQDYGTTTLIADYPEFVVDSYNNIHLFWQDGPFGSDNIFYKKMTEEGLWNPEKKIVSGDSMSSHPSPVIDPTNVLHLVWDDDREGRDIIYYKISTDNGETWSNEIRITHSTAMAWDPVAAIDSDNLIHVAWVDERDGNKEIYYKRTLNPVTEPPIVVTQILNVSRCKPGSYVTISGTAVWNNTPVINANVSVKIIERGTQRSTNTDSNGNYNLTITAPNTPGNYTIRVVVTLGNLTGTKYTRLTVESEGILSGGKEEGGRAGEGLSVIYLAIFGGIASGIIVAFALLRLRRTGTPKVEKQKEERKLDLEFPSKIQTMTLRCPKCGMTFSVEVKPKPFGVKCPNCGKEGVIK